MKTPVLCGVAAAAVMCLWTLVQFFLGWHGEHVETAAKFQFLNWIVWVVLGIVAMYITRANRPAGAGFSYGRAVGSAVICLLVYGATTALFTVLYMQVINPDFADTMVNFQADQMAAKGMSSQQIEGARGFMAKMFHPAFIMIFGIVVPLLAGIVPSLLGAIVVRRAPADTAPAV